MLRPTTASTGRAFICLIVALLAGYIRPASPSESVDLERVRIGEKAAIDYGAFCNDYSLPHYYTSLSVAGSEDSAGECYDSAPWTIFLEGGGLCESIAGCAKRYIDSPFLMSSNDTTESKWPSNVTGYGLLAGKTKGLAVNCTHRILIPYCSSDLWQGYDQEEINRTQAQSRRDDVVEHGSNLNRHLEDGSNENMTVLGTRLVRNLTFRGRHIFEAVIRDAMARDVGNRLCTASMVLLAGSSAGGVGAVALSPWLRSFLDTECTGSPPPVSVLGDSQWFINFDNSLGREEDMPWIPRGNHEYNYCDRALTSDYPCCMATQCILQQPSFTNIPLFTVFSMFDGYIPSLYFQSLGDETDDDGPGGTTKCQLPSSNSAEDKSKPSATKITKSLRFLTEYGGAMNYSLDYGLSYDLMSFFVPSCLQHVYLATSSLWDPDGVLGRSMRDQTYGFKHSQFNQTISQTLWSKVVLPSSDNMSVNCTEDAAVPRDHISLRCAIVTWYNGLYLNATGGDDNGGYSGVPVLRFRESCKGVQCTSKKSSDEEAPPSSCPETIALGELNLGVWSEQLATVILCCISGGIAMLSIVYKLVMKTKEYRFLKQQEQFLRTTWPQERTARQIPYLRDNERISIACLDTKYHAHLSPAAFRMWSRKAEEELRIQEEALMEAMAASAGNVGNGPSAGMDGNLLRDTSLSPSIANMSQRDGCVGCAGSSYQTEILHGISTYFNPGNLIAIMGPSGSGKTTFLDLLTGRRRNNENGRIQGDIFINCRPFENVASSYTRNTGYVLQLAVPYFEELTVRQNLTFAAYMRLPTKLSNEERFMRVEQVIAETGMSMVADTVVGGSTGAGLSGGQKRRLCVALQMLELPKVLILDEPTSGLDATSSMELLKLLAMLAESQRLVIVTIHQPRLEIFHMFDIIVLLCQGELAYYGSPEAAPELFANAICASLQDEDLAKKMDKNPADFIIDVLSNERYRKIIMEHYQKNTREAAHMRNAIEIARDQGLTQKGSDLGLVRPEPRAGSFSRIFVYESRASMRNTNMKRLYLPLIYIGYAFSLGSAYFQVSEKLLLMSTFCIWSFAPSIFMFPAVHGHLSKMLEIFSLEKQDGIGSCWEVVIQTFLRLTMPCSLAIVLCTAILYMMTVPYGSWDYSIYFQLTAFSLTLNMVWTAFAEFIICIDPNFGFKLSPIITSVTGFVGGFLIPKPDMNCWYEWLFYINPNYYGYSGMMFVFLKELDGDSFERKVPLEKCKFDSWIECYPNSGRYFLQKFGFLEVKPYLHFFILLIMMVASLLLAVLVMEIRFNRLKQRIGDTLRCTFMPRKKKSSKYQHISRSHSTESRHSGTEDYRQGGGGGGGSHGLQPAYSSEAVSASALVSSADEGSLLSGGSSSHKPMYPTPIGVSLLSQHRRTPSVSLSMEGESGDEQRPLPVRKVPPSQRKLTRRDTRSNVLGNNKYEVYNPYTASVSVATNMTNASSGSSQMERLQGVLKKSENRRAQMLSRMNTTVSMMHHQAQDDSGVGSIGQHGPGKSSSKKPKKDKRAKAAHLSVDKGDEDKGWGRVRFGSLRRSSAQAPGSPRPKPKRGILKLGRRGLSDAEDTARKASAEKHLTTATSFDLGESPGVRRRRRNSIQMLKSRIFSSSLDSTNGPSPLGEGGARVADFATSMPPSYSPLSKISLHAKENATALQALADDAAADSNGSAAVSAHSTRRSSLARNRALDLIGVEEAAAAATTLQVPCLTGKASDSTPPVIQLRRSSTSTSTLVPDDGSVVRVTNGGRQSPTSPTRRKPPALEEISSASEYFELAPAVAQDHARQLYTDEEDSGDTTPVAAAAEVDLPPPPSPSPLQVEEERQRKKADGFTTALPIFREFDSNGHRHTVQRQVSPHPAAYVNSSGGRPTWSMDRERAPIRQESNGSSLLTGTDISRSSTATSSRSSSYSHQHDPYRAARIATATSTNSSSSVGTDDLHYDYNRYGITTLEDGPSECKSQPLDVVCMESTL
eukprot:scpid3776/ scgid4617/ ABC transporter G family member 22; White-brown complex homolog protein 23